MLSYPSISLQYYCTTITIPIAFKGAAPLPSVWYKSPVTRFEFNTTSASSANAGRVKASISVFTWANFANPPVPYWSALAATVNVASGVVAENLLGNVPLVLFF